jgi:peroxiredoxin
VLALALLAASAPAVAATKPGEKVPPFTLTTYNGETVTLDQLHGKVVILNYWATWCGPCRVELPELDAYMRRHKDAGLAIYAVEISGVPKGKLTRLADVVAFPMVQRVKGRGYGRLNGVPTNYVIDRSGIVRHAQAGAFNRAALEKIVTPLLTEPVPPAAASAQ